IDSIVDVDREVVAVSGGIDVELPRMDGWGGESGFVEDDNDGITGRSLCLVAGGRVSVGGGSKSSGVEVETAIELDLSVRDSGDGRDGSVGKSAGAIIGQELDAVTGSERDFTRFVNADAPELPDRQRMDRSVMAYENGILLGLDK